MTHAQPWATPYISFFINFWTLVEKQVVDYFALYTPVQYCSLLFEMWTSKKKGVSLPFTVCPSSSVVCASLAVTSEQGMLDNLWVRTVLPIPAALQLISNRRHAQMLIYQQKRSFKYREGFMKTRREGYGLCLNQSPV